MTSTTHNSPTIDPPRALLLDMDGTLFLGKQLIEGTDRFIAQLNASNIPYLCLTNNSSKSTTDYKKKLSGLGLDIPEKAIMGSGRASILYLRDVLGWKSAYVVGTQSYRKECVAEGLTEDTNNPDGVLIAYDTELDYSKLSIAMRLIRDDNPDKVGTRPYFATHPDVTCITDTGHIPDIAATIAFLKAVSGREPTVLGKPEKPIIEIALKIMGIAESDRHTVAMVGDKLRTDMALAKKHGLIGCLVMSGDTTEAKLTAHRADHADWPNCTFDTVASMIPWLS